jgi:glycosyltransferase involved in cell wall biosynthesis
VPFFSIILPTRNRRDLVVRAIDSVLAQEFTDYELLIVNNNSSDDTESVVKDKIADCPNAQLLNCSVTGYGAPRNVAMEKATGEYLAFLDDDDQWLPHTLKLYHEIIMSYDFSFLVGKYVGEDSTVNMSVDIIDLLRVSEYTDYLTSYKKFSFITTCSQVVAKRENVIKAGAFTSANHAAEDHDLWLKLGTAARFGLITNPPTVIYREPSGEPSRERILSSVRGKLNLVEMEKARKYPGGRSRRHERQVIITRHTRSTSLAARRVGLSREANQLYWQTLQWNLQQRRWRYLLGYWFVK